MLFYLKIECYFYLKIECQSSKMNLHCAYLRGSRGCQTLGRARSDSRKGGRKGRRPQEREVQGGGGPTGPRGPVHRPLLQNRAPGSLGAATRRRVRVPASGPRAPPPGQPPPRRGDLARRRYIFPLGPSRGSAGAGVLSHRGGGPVTSGFRGPSDFPSPPRPWCGSAHRTP